MEALNKAIGLACEKGGYRWKIDCTMESILLDRLFWQALGKAEGWGQEITDRVGNCLHCGIKTEIQPERHFNCNHVHYPEACKICSKKRITWQENWHSFLDHLTESKDIDSFFNNLLT